MSDSDALPVYHAVGRIAPERRDPWGSGRMKWAHNLWDAAGVLPLDPGMPDVFRRLASGVFASVTLSPEHLIGAADGLRQLLLAALGLAAIVAADVFILYAVAGTGVMAVYFWRDWPSPVWWALLPVLIAVWPLWLALSVLDSHRND